MNVYTDFERYTVLLHAFDTLEGACEYMLDVIAKEECKVLPLIKAWKDGKVAAQWMPKVTDNGVKFLIIENDDFAHNLSDENINLICRMENEDERKDNDVVYLVRFGDGYYYTTGSSAYIIENNFKTGLQLKQGSSTYVTRFPVSKIDDVLKRIIASGYRVCFVG